MPVQSNILRLALARILEREVLRLSRPEPEMPFDEACRVGTSQVDMTLLQDKAEAELDRMGVPVEGVTPTLVSYLFPEAWNEAVRRVGDFGEGLDWDDNGQRGAECVYLFGFLSAPRAAVDAPQI